MSIDLSDKTIMQKMGCPFWQYALFFEIKLAEDDLDYLLNVIKKDKLYSLINDSFYNSKAESNNYNKACAKINQVVFYEGFYNSSDCPQGMKKILFIYLGLLKDWLNENAFGLLEQRHFYVERWFGCIE